MGPTRNDARPAIWDAVKEARLMNPALHITCVDVPATITGQQLSKVLEKPLSDHRELAFYEGVWYVPEIKANQAMPKQIEEFNMLSKKKPLWHTRVNAISSSQEGSKATGGLFNRKKFEWRDSSDPMYLKSWKPVYTDEDYVKADPVKITRDFTGPTIHNKLTGSLQDAGDAE